MSKKNGRPKIEFTDKVWENIEELCKIQCTASEIASFLKTSTDTLSRRVKEKYGKTFAEYYKIHSEGGKSSLRRAQWKKAVHEGNTAMLIWLGKQYLGQTDKVEQADSKDAEKFDKFLDALHELKK
jgi:hypothetical protein